MKTYHQKKGGNYCLLVSVLSPKTVDKVVKVSDGLEKKYRMKFGKAFISRVAIEEFLKLPDTEKLLLDKRTVEYSTLWGK